MEPGLNFNLRLGTKVPEKYSARKYFMTSRFAQLSAMHKIVLIAVIATLPNMVVSTPAAAQTENKNRLAVEIKTYSNFTIPTISDISSYMNKEKESEIVTVEAPVAVEAVSAPVQKAVAITAKATPVSTYQYPPKVVGDARVYMHEPEIREYICPKMGQSQCNIFIAILKAENGTHECTRDNRGLNKNGSVDVGLAQINWNPKWNPPYTVEQLQDCKFNLDIAMKKYEARGFQPWYAYTKGAYKKFLKPTPVAEVAAAIQ